MCSILQNALKRCIVKGDRSFLREPDVMRGLYILRVFFPVLLAVVLFAAPASMAIDYTAKGGASDQERGGYYNQKEKKDLETSDARCTSAEMRELDRQDHVLRKYIKIADRVKENNEDGKYKDKRDYKNAARDLNAYSKYMASDEYRELSRLYKKCGVAQPRAKSHKPFWMP